jgi:ATP-dependent NAD(P)H-hydrate dehydratase
MLVNRAIFEINSSFNADALESRPQIASHLLDMLTSGTLPQQLHSLCALLGGVTVLLKGEDDMVCGSTLPVSRPSSSQPADQLSLSLEGISDVFIIRASEKGAPRRCGGQGDILSGCMATALHWSSALHSTPTSSSLTSLEPLPETVEEGTDGEGKEDVVSEALMRSPTLVGCILAASVVKAASSAAFLRKGRAMTSPDILEDIGRALQRAVEEA